MQKLPKRWMSLSFLLIGGLFFYACVQEKIVEHEDDLSNQGLTPEPGKKSVKIAVRVPNNSMKTYSVETGSNDENHIDTLFVKIFEDNVFKETKKFYGDVLKAAYGSNDTTVIVAFEMDNLSGGTVTAEVYANRMEIRPITDEIPLPDRTHAATCFMMSGSGVLSYSGNTYSGTIHIVRDVAKLRIKIDKNSICIPDNLIIHYDKIKIETRQAPDRTQLLSPPPLNTPSGLTYIPRYATHTENTLRSKTPIITFSGGQIDSLYLNENYLNNNDYNDSNITQVTITIPTQEPGMPVKTAEYTYKLSTEGSFQIKRNYIYILDIRVAGQSLDPFISLDMTPWLDVDIEGDIYGAILNLDQATVNLSPVHTSDNPATIQYATDNSSITLDWSSVDPAHNIDTSTEYLSGKNGKIPFSWIGGGAPDYPFKDTLYVTAGNIVKSIVLDYQPPAGSFGNWVGTFHRWNQTGERIIKMRNTGAWKATVVQGDDFILLDSHPTQDVNWGTALAALGNDVDFDNAYPVSGTATTVSGSGIIYFRVGLKSALAKMDAHPRYGLIEVATHEGTKKIYVRQGEAADYVMRREDPNPANGNNPRPYAMRFSPFNLTDPQRGTGGNDVTLHNDYRLGVVLASRYFTEYPTQAGYFFKWNLGEGNDLKVYHPVNTIPSINGWTTATKSSWNRLLEPCPPGYRHPNDSLRSPLTSEFRQSLYAIPNGNTYGPVHPDNMPLDNSLWGFYADGFFDRLAVETSPNGIISTTVSYNALNLAAPANTKIAYAGRLFYNPTTFSSLFLPAPGLRDGNEGGALKEAGYRAAYWTNSPNGNNGWAFYFTPSSFYGYNNAHQSNGASVRCVHINFGLPGSL